MGAERPDGSGQIEALTYFSTAMDIVAEELHVREVVDAPNRVMGTYPRASSPKEDVEMTMDAEPARERGLRRELRFWEAIALSIGIMAPGCRWRRTSIV